MNFMGSYGIHNDEPYVKATVKETLSRLSVVFNDNPFYPFILLSLTAIQGALKSYFPPIIYSLSWPRLIFHTSMHFQLFLPNYFL